MELNNRVLFDLTEQVIGAALQVHKDLGPGLLESAYEECLSYELVQRALKVERQVGISLGYKSLSISNAYRIDLLVSDVLIVEIKTVDKVSPLHSAQLLTYLKLTGLEVGLLINFNSVMLRDGIKRYVNSFKAPRAPRAPRLLPPPPLRGKGLAPTSSPALEESVQQINSSEPRE